MSSNVVTEAISDVPFGVVMAWVLSILAIITACVAIGIRIYHGMEKYRKSRNTVDHKNEEFEEVKHESIEMKKSIDALTVATRELMADRINERYKRYLHLGYIPEDEVTEFQNMFAAYEGVHGNGSIKLKYEKAMSELSIKLSDET